jgi:flagellar biosynthetic protein FlhB
VAESNKTEKATPKKRRDERKKGNAFQSKDVISVVVLLVGFILLSKLGSFIVAQIKELYLSQMIKIESLHKLTIQTCTSMLVEGVKVFYISVTPILIILALVGILMTGVQTRFLISGDLLKLKIQLKRLFSIH